MEKLYDRIDWNNNTSPALNDTNLNLMSKAVDDIDDRVVDIAGTVMETVPQIQEDLEEAQDLLEDAEAISTHPPIIGQNGNWWTWDTTIEDYADSGIDAGVSLTIGTTSTLTPGSDATVTNSGTATDPILNFGIPAGVAGQNGQDGADGADGADGVSPTVTIGTITGGHSVTITDADHPTGQTFNVMDGEDGVGIPSGGTTGQVLKKASGTDYDTEWGTASSGGHTILNGSGSAMTQRGKLQFVDLNVSDDSENDKTVVTAPTPDYVDEQFDSSKTYSKGMTCIEGNVRYRYKNSTASSGHRPPNATYWEELSVSSQLSSTETVLYDSGNITSSSWTDQSEYNRYIRSVGTTSSQRANVRGHVGYGRLYVQLLFITSTGGTSSIMLPMCLDNETLQSNPQGSIIFNYTLSSDAILGFQFALNDQAGYVHITLSGSDRAAWKQYTYRIKLIGIN